MWPAAAARSPPWLLQRVPPPWRILGVRRRRLADVPLGRQRSFQLQRRGARSWWRMSLDWCSVCIRVSAFIRRGVGKRRALRGPSWLAGGGGAAGGLVIGSWKAAGFDITTNRRGKKVGLENKIQAELNGLYRRGGKLVGNAFPKDRRNFQINVAF
jgi:hypothetical protein